MPRAYPVELRERVVRAVDENGLSYEDAGETFDIGEATVSLYLHRARHGPRRLVFIDETGCNCAMARHYARAPAGKRCSIASRATAEGHHDHRGP